MVCLFRVTSKPAVCCTKIYFQEILWILSSGTKNAECESDVKNTWIYNSILPYFLVSLCLRQGTILSVYSAQNSCGKTSNQNQTAAFYIINGGICFLDAPNCWYLFAGTWHLSGIVQYQYIKRTQGFITKCKCEKLRDTCAVYLSWVGLIKK
jgi:hypothetical protein